MTTPSPAAPAPTGSRLLRPVRELGRFAQRVPLRLKLVVIMSALLSVALVLTGLAASTAMRHYLMSRVDGQLKQAATQITDRAAHDGTNNSDFRPPPNGGDGPAQQVDGDGDHQLLPSDYYAQISDSTGTPTGLASYPLQNSSSTPAIPNLSVSQIAARADVPFTVGSTDSGTHWRVVLSVMPDGSHSVAVATPLSDVDSTLGRLGLFELTIGATVLLILAGVSYLAVRRSLRPLVDVEHTAEAIAAGDLSRRVPEGDPRTEVGGLSVALNGMLGQIETAFLAREASEREARDSEGRMRRFVTDASHELRTPLTSIRGFAELYRIGAVADAGEVARVMRRIEDEAARMGLLVDDLLMLARLDQQRPLEHQLVDVRTIAADAVHDAQAVAPTREISLREAENVPQLVVGDEARLRQVVGNLVTNALTHTPPSASITIGAQARTIDASAWVVIEVSDTGPGLSRDDAAHVFERFYRVERSRDRATGGSGLGLSIVAALVAAHGGRVELDTAPGQGATFRAWLPAAATAVERAEPAAPAEHVAPAETTGPDAGQPSVSRA